MMQSFNEPDYARDGYGSHLTGERRIAADVEVLKIAIAREKPNLAAWWARTLFRDARRFGMLADYERGR